MLRSLDPFSRTVANIIIIIVVVFFAVCIYRRIANFLQELKYVNAEIKRTYGREQKHWISRRKKLWLSLLPFGRRK